MATALLGLLALFAADADEPLQRGVSALMKLQADDGGWHSTYYGNLRPGAAVTSLVLYSVGQTPDATKDPLLAKLRAGYGFVRRGLAEKGCVVNPDGSPDFPTYSTALILLATQSTRLGASKQEQQVMRSYLINAQLGSRRGFGKDSLHFGGWDLMGLTELQGNTSGTNISISRYAIEALADSDDEAAKATVDRGERWLRHVQNQATDGGFYFTPEMNAVANKAGSAKEGGPPRSYATAVCDGLLALKAAGVGENDRRIKQATAWLVKHDVVNEAPGFPAEDPSDWNRGLRFYYWMGLARCMPLLPDEHAAALAKRLKKEIISHQQKNGLWSNESARMREDDPIIATCFAITALAAIDRYENREQR